MRADPPPEPANDDGEGYGDRTAGAQLMGGFLLVFWLGVVALVRACTGH